MTDRSAEQMPNMIWATNYHHNNWWCKDPWEEYPCVAYVRSDELARLRADLRNTRIELARELDDGKMLAADLERARAALARSEAEKERLRETLESIEKHCTEMYEYIERGPGLAAVGNVLRFARAALREEPDNG